MADQTFTTPGGIKVSFFRQSLDDGQAIAALAERLDVEKGMLLSSGIDFPGRYNRWEVGFVNPPVEVIATQTHGVTFTALNPRGMFIIGMLRQVLEASEALTVAGQPPRGLCVQVRRTGARFPEEQRSHQPSLVTPLAVLIQEFEVLKENMLGFFGAFAYELLYEFEPCRLAKPRSGEEKIYHLYFVDNLLVWDKQTDRHYRLTLEFLHENVTSVGHSTTPYAELPQPAEREFRALDRIQPSWSDEAFARKVDEARDHIKAGDVFEVVLARSLTAPCEGAVSDLYARLKQINPSPYEYLCQFGDEQLVGTSPEMFVRCEGRVVESCPISGTIKRGSDAMEDEKQIRGLLNSYKDEVELTMCTDVDRNDKSRICEPDSVTLLSRRTIERYTGLFHTVDHVCGTLREGFCGLDAFLSHMWAVTLTGAPKKWAAQIIEDKEEEVRSWYGGSVGALGFNGDINSAITIRTIHIKNGQAGYRVGATLVWDSKGMEEAEETRTKATLFYKAMDQFTPPAGHQVSIAPLKRPCRALMIDHEDSFVHTLAAYFRYLGVTLETYRAGVLSAEEIAARQVDLVIYSPGPGRPDDFALPAMIRALTAKGIPQFGVCLGLQGMVEAFGGSIRLLEAPHHGKVWQLSHTGSGLFAGVSQNCEVAAYHSFIASTGEMPASLESLAVNDNNDLMAVRHKTSPLMAVQFHPESILTLKHRLGLLLLRNALTELVE